MFSWELGGGLGHTAPYKNIIEKLSGNGAECYFSAIETTIVNDILRDKIKKTIDLPKEIYKKPKRINSTSLPDMLLNLGMDDIDHCRKVFATFNHVWKEPRDYVWCLDHAPLTAIWLYAQDIPFFSIGGGFSIPPRSNPIRGYLNHDPESDARSDDALSKILNVLLANFGKDISCISDIYVNSTDILRTLPEFDHFFEHRNQADYFGPGKETHISKEKIERRSSKHVFAYLKSSPINAPLIRTITLMGYSIDLYSPGTENTLPETSGQVRVLSQPASITSIATQTDLIICNAGHTLCSSMALKGKPQLLVPLNVEQYMLAKRMSQQGLALVHLPHETISVAKLRRLLRRLPQIEDNVKHLANRYRHFDQSQADNRIADLISQKAAQL